MSHFNQENPQDPFEIPPEILHTADDFPVFPGFEVKAGPTYIEFQRKFKGFLFALYFVSAIEMASGILLVLFELYFGIIFSLLASTTIFIAVKFSTGNKYFVVLDFASEMIYIGEKDIRFLDIESLALVKVATSWSNLQNVSLFGIELYYRGVENPTEATILFRLLSNLKNEWDEIGNYFARSLSQICRRNIEYNPQPRDRSANEKCARFVRMPGRYSLNWE